MSKKSTHCKELALEAAADAAPLPWLAGAVQERNPWPWTVGLAILLHGALLAVHLPAQQVQADEPAPKAIVIPLKDYRLAPPLPPPDSPTPKPRAARRPLPVPEAPSPAPVRPVERLTASLEPVPWELDFEVDAPLELPTSAPLDPEEPRRLGGDIVAPVPLEQPRPVYTELARRARIQGTVVLDTVIGTDGQVHEIQMLKGLPLGLDQAALSAVGRWTYRPATLGGRPVAVRMTASVAFNLQ